MGVLYNTVNRQEQNLKRENILDRLNELGIKASKEGKPFHEISYRDLKMELALAEICAVDITNPENKWY